MLDRGRGRGVRRLTVVLREFLEATVEGVADRRDLALRGVVGGTGTSGVPGWIKTPAESGVAGAVWA